MLLTSASRGGSQAAASVILAVESAPETSDATPRTDMINCFNQEGRSWQEALLRILRLLHTGGSRGGGTYSYSPGDALAALLLSGLFTTGVADDRQAFSSALARPFPLIVGCSLPLGGTSL